MLFRSRVLAAVWDRPGRLHPQRRAGVLAPGAWAHLAVYDLAHPAFFPGADPLSTLAFADPSDALVGMMTAGSKVAPWGAEFRSSLRARGRAAYQRAQAHLQRVLAPLDS